MTFEQMVRSIRSALGSRSRIIHVPVRLAKLAAPGIGVAVRDVVITDHELGGLMSELAHAERPATGQTRFSDWIAAEGPSLGRSYASEVVRHF